MCSTNVYDIGNRIGDDSENVVGIKVLDSTSYKLKVVKGEVNNILDQSGAALISKYCFCFTLPLS